MCVCICMCVCGLVGDYHVKAAQFFFIIMDLHITTNIYKYIYVGACFPDENKNCLEQNIY